MDTLVYYYKTGVKAVLADDTYLLAGLIFSDHITVIMVAGKAYRLVSIHVLAGCTTALDVWTPMFPSNPSLCNKSLRARNYVAQVNLLRGLCRNVLWLWCRKQKDLLSFKKKEQSLKQKNLTATFGKSLFLTQYRMRYAINIPPNTKDLTINLTMVAYGNQQTALSFARLNNSDLLRVLKHLMETRLKTALEKVTRYKRI